MCESEVVMKNVLSMTTPSDVLKVSPDFQAKKIIRLVNKTRNKGTRFCVIVSGVNKDYFNPYRIADLKYSLTLSQLITSKNALMYSGLRFWYFR